MLRGRTLQGIVKQFYDNISIVKPGAKLINIDPVQNALTVERVVELFAMAFWAGLRVGRDKLGLCRD